ncbi:hypothetical protein QOZ80_2BG0193300 [Eleusine coracana subsp. coracana]|nr:hypothetical protein QOZ80_2BG0193300 [Eleusine coracana subsp. coracana]
MAGGRAPEMCVGPWASAAPVPAVAGGHDVALPGFLVDSLAEDMRRGDAMFEVQLTVLDEEGWRMVTCWARLGDDSGAALNIPCKETRLYIRSRAVLFFIWRASELEMSPEYTVAIGAVSGLDPATEYTQPAGRGRGVLSPAFNMTIGLASHSTLRGGCIKLGTTIRVSYSSLRLPLASGRAPEMCVGRRPSMDSLAEELRRGEAVFEVKLTSLGEEGNRWDVVKCLATAGSGADSTPCDLSFVSFDSIPVPQQGDSSGYVPSLPDPVPADASAVQQ